MPFKGSEAQRFGELIASLAAVFGRELDRPMIGGYEIALDDLPLDDIARGVRRAIRECRHMPNGAELRELAGVKPVEHRAAVAFQRLRETIRRLGAYRTVDFDDHTVNATVRNLGGWEHICNLLAGEEFETFFRKEFIRVYCGMLKQGFSQDMGAPLQGICDRENQASGYGRLEGAQLVVTGLPASPPRKGLANHKPQTLIPEMKGAE